MMVSLSPKLKMLKTCEKLLTLELFCKKNCLKKKPLVKKKTLEKTPNIGELSKSAIFQGYNDLCKMVSLGQKSKMPKTCDKHSTRTLELFCAKNRSKKPQILEK